jgi:hypothetical protein
MEEQRNKLITDDDRNLTEKDLSDIKLEINRLLWMWGKPTLTLREADDLSCSILDIIIEGKI